MINSHTSSIEERASLLKEKAKEVRIKIIEMIYQAQSGHPGGSLSIADIMTVLYFDLLRVDPHNPRWRDRDRVVLSKGHACPALYACLAMRDFFPIGELRTLRKIESILQGHPDMKKTPGVDMTTGSLGHGLSIGVGMALEARLMKKDYHVYVILGDGELNEGQVWEAAESGHKYSLDNLVAIIDRNRLQLDGYTEDIMPMEPIDQKFEAFNWHVMKMNGHDVKDILTTLENARIASKRPICIIADTIKGKGVSYMENQQFWHGKVPDKEQYEKAIMEIRQS